MGLLIYPVFQSAVPARETHTTGEFLAAKFTILDEIAEDHRLTPITAFADQREVPLGFDGPPWELDDILGPCGDWFPAQDGYAGLLALAELLRKRPDVALRLESAEAVVEELEDLAGQLAIAVKAGVPFRLEMR